MKKLIDIIKKFSFYLTVGLGGFYLYWFITFPFYETFYYIPFLFIFLVFVVVMLKLSSNKTLNLPLTFFTLLAFTGNILYSKNFYPRTIDNIMLGNVKYAISSSRDMDNHLFIIFHKCNRWGFKCESLYGSYSWEKSIKIFIDKTNNEVSLIQGETFPRLTYTEGRNPHTYYGYPVELNNHLYYLSENCYNMSCNNYVYSLYKCNPDNTSCDPLPIHYTGTHYNFLLLDGNEAANEINLYNGYDDSLIFTYGKQPRCYVEGCEILKALPNMINPETHKRGK